MKSSERPVKRAKLLDDVSDDDSGSEASASTAPKFTVNEEYARRFEHNSKREEKQRLEEKYGRQAALPKRRRDDGDDLEDEDAESSSEYETEDDEGDFATHDVDDEIMATLQAIRSKDPRVYDAKTKFFKEFDPETNEQGRKNKDDKPLYLHDYHRQNLMNGLAGGEDEEASAPIRTFQYEQEQLRRELVGSMHAQAQEGDDEVESGASDSDGFLVAKSKPKHESLPQRSALQITERDVAEADKDPETFLSNFMASRAWVPNVTSKWQAFDSDDSEDEQRAEDFEEAYNLRFEDPAKANEKLQSYSRDVAKYSVRREEKSGRKRAREKEQDKKEEIKREREEERARLRRLKLEEAEEKLKKIKEAAGIAGKQVLLADWQDVIEGDFDDERWETEMQRRFGDDYYADQDGEQLSEGVEDGQGKRRKLKKPKWDDEIDINDIVPDFGAEEDEPQFTLSDDERLEHNGVQDSSEDGNEQPNGKKRKTKKDRAKEKSEAKRAARLERRQLEEMVDAALPIDHPSLAVSNGSSRAPAVAFRYRETSPTSFGLSSRDILFASDAQLNQFAGLKKLATFRDIDRKRKDKKKLSKKARLREWRKDTFGHMDAPTGGFEKLLGRMPTVNVSKPPASLNTDGMVEGPRKKKRSRKAKKTEVSLA